MIKLSLTYKQIKERGSFFLFFTAGLLPLLLLIVSLSVDFSIYLRNDQKLQELGDQAAILGWRYLPYQLKAEQAARQYLKSKGLGNNIINIGIAAARPGSHQFNDEFEVSLKQDLPLKLISYLLPEAKLETRALSRARATPRDILIAFDRSFYMASNSLQDNLVDQPFSGFIRDHAPFDPFLDPQSSGLIKTAPVTFMTQLCFNPFYSEVKKAAISMYEYFAAAGRNGVGMAVFPGLGTENMRFIRPVLRPQQNVVITLNDSGEAMPLQISERSQDQDYYIYNSARVGASSWCAGVAANELSAALKLPEIYTAVDIQKLWRSPGKNLSFAEVINFNQNSISYNTNYQPVLTVKEVAWSAVVKNSAADTKAVIDSAIANLITGPEFENQTNSALRTGLAGTSTKTAIILAGDVPYFNSQRFVNSSDSVSVSIKSSFENIKPILTLQPNLKFKLIYAIINDPVRLNKPEQVRERAQQLDILFAEILATSEDYKNLEIELIYSEDLETLTQQVLVLSILDNNNKVLSY